MYFGSEQAPTHSCSAVVTPACVQFYNGNVFRNKRLAPGAITVSGDTSGKNAKQTDETWHPALRRRLEGPAAAARRAAFGPEVTPPSEELSRAVARHSQGRASEREITFPPQQAEEAGVPQQEGAGSKGPPHLKHRLPEISNGAQEAAGLVLVVLVGRRRYVESLIKTTLSAPEEPWGKLLVV